MGEPLNEQGERREKRVYTSEYVQTIGYWMHWPYLPVSHNTAISPRYIPDPFMRFVAYMEWMTKEYPSLLIDGEGERSPYIVYQKHWLQPTIDGKYDKGETSLRNIMKGLGQLVPTERGLLSQQIIFSSLLSLSMDSRRSSRRDAADEIAHDPLGLRESLLDGSTRFSDFGYDLEKIYWQNMGWGHLHDNAVAQAFWAVGPRVLGKASNYGIEHHIQRDDVREAITYYLKDKELSEGVMEAMMASFRETNLFVMGSVAMNPAAFDLLHYR